MWQHNTSLHKKQDVEDLKLASKLTEAHINFKTHKNESSISVTNIFILSF